MQIKIKLRSAVMYLWSWYRRKLQMIESAVCHGSMILSAVFLRQLNHTHKSWPI